MTSLERLGNALRESLRSVLLTSACIAVPAGAAHAARAGSRAEGLAVVVGLATAVGLLRRRFLRPVARRADGDAGRGLAAALAPIGIPCAVAVGIIGAYVGGGLGSEALGDLGTIAGALAGFALVSVGLGAALLLGAGALGAYADGTSPGAAPHPPGPAGAGDPRQDGGSNNPGARDPFSPNPTSRRPRGSS